jgi:hypothetical protein
MKTVSTWVFILAIVILTSGHSAAVKIEDNKGRAIDVDIIEADKETIKIRKTGDEKVFSLQRATLSPDSNTLIDEFLQARKEEEAKEALGKVEVIVNGGPELGSWKFRMKPPLKSMQPFAYKNQKTMTVGVPSGNLEPLLIFITPKSELEEDLAKHAKQKAEGFFGKDKITWKTVQYGEWSGYIVENPPKFSPEWRALLHRGDVSLHVVYTENANGTIREEMIPDLVKSITIEKVD